MIFLPSTFYRCDFFKLYVFFQQKIEPVSCDNVVAKVVLINPISELYFRVRVVQFPQFNSMLCRVMTHFIYIIMHMHNT